MLETNFIISNIFNERPLFSFKRDLNLCSFLVKGAFHSFKEPGTFRCSRPICSTFPYIVSHTHITGPKSSHNITDYFDCVTSNVGYCIKCSRCNLLYIGETGRRLGDRVNNEIMKDLRGYDYRD